MPANRVAAVRILPPLLWLSLLTNGTVQGAIDWLDKNQEKSIEEIKASQASSSEEPPEVKPGEELAKSLVCDDCGKQFRSVPQAEFHASKSYVPRDPTTHSILG